jgi:hypothetical protein
MFLDGDDFNDNDDEDHPFQRSTHDDIDYPDLSPNKIKICLRGLPFKDESNPFIFGGIIESDIKRYNNFDDDDMIINEEPVLEEFIDL